MGCLNSKSTADGKAASKLPAKGPKGTNAAASTKPSAAPKAPASAKTVPAAPKPADPKPATPKAAPAAAAPVTKEAPKKEESASAASEGGRPNVSSPPSIAHTTVPSNANVSAENINATADSVEAEAKQSNEAAAAVSEEKPADSEKPAESETPAEAKKTVAKAVETPEKSSTGGALAGSEKPAEAEAPAETEKTPEKSSVGNALAAILRQQVADYEARRHSESTTESPKSTGRRASATLDHDESAILPEEAEEIKEAAASYNANYKERMGHLKAPRTEEKVAPFIGFSLADNIKEGALVVDGVYHDGPAYQVGVDVDHELVSIAGRPATSITETRALVEKYCRPGRITKFKFRKPSGEPYEALVYVLTADKKYEGKPYFFDVSKQSITQSDRLKQTWRESSSPNRSA